MKEFLHWFYINIRDPKNAGFILFGLGILVSIVSKKIKDFLDRRSYRRSINLVIKTFSIECKNQSKSINQTLKEASFIEGKDFNVIALNINSLSYLSKIDSSLFIKNYVTGFNKETKRRASSILFEMIGKVDTFRLESKELVQMIFGKYTISETMYYKNLEDLNIICNKLIVANNIEKDTKIISGTIISDYLIIWAKWEISGGSNTIKDTYNNLVKPLDNLIQNYKTHPLTLEMIDKISSCHFAFDNIVKIDRTLHNRFEKQSIQMKRISSILNIVLQVFNHKNTKRCKFYKWLK
jgi:hypothetical protein